MGGTAKECLLDELGCLSLKKENKVGGGVERKHCFRQVFNGTLEGVSEINTFRFKNVSLSENILNSSAFQKWLI